MITDSEKELEKIYLSYSKILNRLKLQNIKTSRGNNITYMDLKQAVIIMNKKHPTCRWKQKKANGKFYVLIEGYYWLIYVYFQNEKKLIDADIYFFIERIKQYEELLKVEHKNLMFEDMNISALSNYFDRAEGTIKHNIGKLNKATNGIYIYYKNGIRRITKEGIEWLCKNCFKQKYLELLERYKMELTEKYIKKGYSYDIF